MGEGERGGRGWGGGSVREEGSVPREKRRECGFKVWVRRERGTRGGGGRFGKKDVRGGAGRGEY